MYAIFTSDLLMNKSDFTVMIFYLLYLSDSDQRNVSLWLSSIQIVKCICLISLMCRDAKSCRCCRYICAIFSAGSNFWASLGHFWAILAILGHLWANLGNFGSFLGYFGSFLGHFLVLIFCGKICLCAI